MLRLTVRNIFSKVGTIKPVTSFISCYQSNMSATEPSEQHDEETSEESEPKKESSRLKELRKQLKEELNKPDSDDMYNITTPVKNDPLPPWPDNVNPHTGEIGGPRGPEPTRYGDWERKGICVDF